jgi:hypothetical protein
VKLEHIRLEIRLLIRAGQMHFRLTGDIASESGLGALIGELSGPMRQYFVPKSYGEGLLGVVAVLMCQDSKLDLKQRIRLSHKEKKLYIDIMLDLAEIRSMNDLKRKKAVFDQLISVIANELQKRPTLDFDSAHFLEDLRNYQGV